MSSTLIVSEKSALQTRTSYCRYPGPSPKLRLVICESRRSFNQSKPQSLDELFELLERRWTLRILWLLAKGPKRYGALREHFGINPNTLRDRLFELEDAGIIVHLLPGQQRLYASYELSEVGVKIVRALQPLEKLSKSLRKAREKEGPSQAIVELEDTTVSNVET